MMRRLIDLAVAALFGGSMVLTCSSCSTLSSDHAHAATKPSALPATRWEQVSFGREAQFAVCVEPECPRVTPKTLAQPSTPVAAAPTMRPVSLVPDDTPAVSAPPTKPPVQLSRLETQSVVINFPLGSAVLTEAGRTRIRQSIETAKAADRIVISGRTDALGGDKVNESLALARARAVRNYFRDLAPDLPATFSIDAKGRCCFVASNDDEPGRSKNRRVEVHFSSSGGA
jgi:outer membrane protein OmpA-like peptidoglycan-associated protein